MSYKLPEAKFFTQAFCRSCGSPAPRLDHGRHLAIVPLGALDDDPGVRPSEHIWTGSKAAWFEIADGLTQHPGAPPATRLPWRELAPTAASMANPVQREGLVHETELMVRAIGRVESPVRDTVDCDWGRVESRIVLDPQYRPGLHGLDDFSHVVVVTFLHFAAFDPDRHLVRRPRGLATMPEIGIFAQRAKDRPNPLGITVVRLLGVASYGVTVQGLDAIDGTPVLDLKPYFPDFDAAPGARVPAWVDELMKGYF